MIKVASGGKIIIDEKESNFKVQEFVPRRVYEYFGSSSIWFLDSKLIRLTQFMRTYFADSMRINDWSYGGKFQYRGFRPDVFYYEKQESGLYKDIRKGKYSQHRYGRAVDCNFSKLTPDQARKEIMDNEEMWLEVGLTVIEDGAFSPTWLHFDIRNTGKNTIFVVKP
jgi:hypothetical protein